MFTVGQVVLPIIRLLCIVIGAYLFFKALWLLRIGENERGFILRAVIGVVIGTLPWWGFILLFYIPFLSHLVGTGH